jgi:hypothetical protein
MKQLDQWLAEEGHTVTKLTAALGISRQAYYSGRERESFSRRTAAGISAITGIPMVSAEDEEIKRYAREALKRWRRMK